MDYQTIKDKWNKNEIYIGVEPAIARKFFMYTNHDQVVDTIGESLFIERFFVKLFFILEWLCLPVGFILSIITWQWYSIIIIPVMFLLAFFFNGKASVGKQSIVGVTILTLTCFLLAFFINGSTFMFYYFIFLPLPYLFARLVYKSSVFFMRGLVLRNELVYKMLAGTGIFIREIL
ncbi:MAG: hypothetical protein IAE93_05885 [Ignavibacteria bacterium]|nr:hypothetical protein [Ignavibacteria bacterium]